MSFARNWALKTSVVGDEASLSSEDRVLALSDSCVWRTAGTGWRLDEALEDVMEVLELTVGFLRTGVGRGRAREAASSASSVL
jgi:hypothetical protein